MPARFAHNRKAANGALPAVLCGKKPGFSVLGLLGGAIMFLVGLAYVFAIWGADGLEIERHLTPFWLLAILVVLILPAVLWRAKAPEENSGQSPLRDSY